MMVDWIRGMQHRRHSGCLIMQPSARSKTDMTGNVTGNINLTDRPNKSCQKILKSMRPIRRKGYGMADCDGQPG